MQSASPDFAQVKSNLKASWMAGDFGQIANYAVKAGEDFVARTEIKPGARVLDVACGTGNTAIPAARAGGLVTGVDIAPNLLEQARKRAVAEQLEIRFDDRWRNENRSRVSGCQSDPWLGSPQSSWLAMARRCGLSSPDDEFLIRVRVEERVLQTSPGLQTHTPHSNWGERYRDSLFQ